MKATILDKNCAAIILHNDHRIEIMTMDGCSDETKAMAKAMLTVSSCSVAQEAVSAIMECPYVGHPDMCAMMHDGVNSQTEEKCYAKTN